MDAKIVNLYSTIPMGWACALVYLLPLKKCDRNKYWIPFAWSVAAFEYCDWWWGDQQGAKTPRRPRAESSHASRQYMGNTGAGWPRNFAISFTIFLEGAYAPSRTFTLKNLFYADNIIINGQMENLFSPPASSKYTCPQNLYQQVVWLQRFRLRHLLWILWLIPRIYMKPFFSCQQSQLVG